ncbi:MAG: GlsB/YeaQ/YmgE family stress response membrane protein [Solirubrobacteraceae bacterium]
MSELPFLVIVFFGGLFIGALARLLLPGEDPMGIAFTATVGVFGSFTGGLFSWYLLDKHSAGVGIVLAVVFSMLFLLLLRFLRNAGGSRRTMGGGPTHR